MYVACLQQILIRDSGLASALCPGCWHAIITSVGNHPHMSVHEDNTTPISNDGIARLGPMVWSQVRVPVGADLRHTEHVQ